ncbi:TolB family protein [Cloacibacterium sp.]|uniref:TolB family protein n=1 Tax=Cloacibacterium sp. TaxID=1913682 RepID=UPI0039E6AF3D
MKNLNFFKTILSAIAFSLILNSCGSKKITSFAQIDLAPAVTPDAKELTRVTDDNLQNFYPVLSPDGKKLLYHTIDPGQVGSKRSHIDLKTIGSQGTTPLLTEGCMFPSWMPDSKGFYFTYAVPTKPVIAKSKIDQGGINYVSPNSNGDDDHYSSFLKGINKILFTTKIGSDYQLCTMDPTGLNFTLLGVGESPYPHPSNKEFLFSKKVGNFYQIFIYNLETGQQTQVTSGDFDYVHPKYSPDGKLIVFSKREKNKNGNQTSSHIFLMDSNGGSVKQLTTGNTWNATPSFGSDGFIYFSSNAGNSDTKRSWDNFDVWRLIPNL